MSFSRTMLHHGPKFVYVQCFKGNRSYLVSAAAFARERRVRGGIVLAQ